MSRSIAKSLSIALVFLLTMGIAFGAVVSQSDYDMLKSKLAAGQILSRADIDKIIDLHDSGMSIVDDWELGQLKEYGYIGERPAQPRRPGNTLDEYVWSTTTYDWFDITTLGTEHPLADDSGTVVNLPFAFPFYDNTYNTVKIGSNGYLELGGTGTGSDLSNDPIPSDNTPDNIVAMLWDDLDPDRGNDGTIYAYDDAANNRFVVQFEGVNHYSSATPPPQLLETFQCFLYANGNIVIQWETVARDTSCTVGIENIDGTDGVQVCYNATGGQCPANGTAIIINQPDGVPNPVTNLTVAQVGADVQLTWTDPTQDTNGNTITPTNIQVWLGEPGDGTLLGTVGAGVGTYTHLNAPDGNLIYNVRAFLDPYYSAPVSLGIIVGNPSYMEDFEVTGGLWESDNPAGWQWGAPAFEDGPAAAHSGTNLWGTVLTDDYVLDACYHLTLPLNLTVINPAATVEFWGWYDSELAYDGCNLKVSTDGGTTWEIVDPIRPYDQTSFNTNNECQPAERGWAGHEQGFWEYIILPIGQYNGQVLQFRFTFGSDGSIQYPGFYFDDMVIWGLSEPVGAEISGTVSFDGGAGDLTAVTVHADGLGNPVTNPAANGSYTLNNVLVGNRIITASLAGYNNATTSVNVPEGGLTGVDLTLVRVDPPVPTGLQASISNTTGIVSLQWDTSADPLVDRYSIFRKLRDDADFVMVGSSTTTTYDDDLNTPGPGIYLYAISAVDLDVSTPVESDMTPSVEVLYGELPPAGLAANGNYDDKIVLDWFEPGTPPEFELFYDHGGASDVDGLGWWGNQPSFGWMVAKFQTISGPATVTKLKIMFTDFATEGDLVQLGLFADNGGVPTFTPLSVVDYNMAPPYNEFIEFTLPEPVTFNDGIIWAGARQTTANTMAVGGDETTPFLNDHFKFSYDATTWTAYESLDPPLLTIPMLRCFAIGQFGALVELTPSPIDVAEMPSKAVDGKDTKTASVVEIPENWMTSSSDYQFNFESILDRAASAVASHAPYCRPVDNRSIGNTLDDVVYYIVYRDGSDIGHPVDEHFEDTGRTENVSHAYYVTAYYDNSVESGPTATVNRACNMAPAAPTNLAGSSSGNTQMVLSWIDPIANADGTSCIDLANVRIYRNETLVGTVAAGVEQYIDTPPVPDMFYTWTVTAIDEVPNESPVSLEFYGAVQSPWQEIEYEWVDISTTGTSAGVDDDGATGPHNLGFDFEFYGNSYNAINICSNGFLNFGTLDSSLTNTTLPDAAVPNNAIYPFWDDLNPAASGQVLYYADAANGQFIVSWLAVPHYNTEDYYTFQAIISSANSIRFNYQTIVTNTTCTVGVENEAGDDAILLCFDGDGWLPDNSSAIEFWGGPAGEIAGQVRRIGNNAPIEGAIVTTLELPGAMTTTDATGAYSLNIEPGTYTVLVHKQGYCDISDPNVVVEDDNTTNRLYTMSYPVGSASVTSVNMETELGVNDSRQFDLINGSTATCEFSYEITADVQWLSFSPADGDIALNSSQTITVTADVTGMPVGTYNATIHVENNGETNPIDIPVVLEIAEDVSDIGFVPTEFAFYQNYPNPFNATTALQFDVPVETAVEIVIFNVMGQIVDKPVSAYYPAGRYKILYSADALPSGMYLVKMSAGDFSGVHKMMLLK